MGLLLLSGCFDILHDLCHVKVKAICHKIRRLTLRRGLGSSLSVKRSNICIDPIRNFLLVLICHTVLSTLEWVEKTGIKLEHTLVNSTFEVQSWLISICNSRLHFYITILLGLLCFGKVVHRTTSTFDLHLSESVNFMFPEKLVRIKSYSLWI